MNKILTKKYKWFKRIVITELKYSVNGKHINPVGEIYVDSDWAYDQWREYHYSTPFPDLENDNYDISFGDFIGGELSKDLQNDFKSLFSVIAGEKTPKYMSFSWLGIQLVDDGDLKEQIGETQNTMSGGDKPKVKVIESLLNKIFVNKNSDIVCGVEVKHPDDREVLNGQQKFQSYSITITFIGGYGTKFWPRTMAVNDKYDDLMNEVWHLVYDYTNTPCDIYSKYVKVCDKK